MIQHLVPHLSEHQANILLDGVGSLAKIVHPDTSAKQIHDQTSLEMPIAKLVKQCLSLQ